VRPGPASSPVKRIRPGRGREGTVLKGGKHVVSELGRPDLSTEPKTAEKGNLFRRKWEDKRCRGGGVKGSKRDKKRKNCWLSSIPKTGNKNRRNKREPKSRGGIKRISLERKNRADVKKKL